jgi:tRNA pseudouridine32 synthase/23S rRNA pseudouridine746 synthase
VSKGEKRNYEACRVRGGRGLCAFAIHDDIAGIQQAIWPAGPDAQYEDRTAIAYGGVRAIQRKRRVVHRRRADVWGIVAAKTQPAAAALSQAFAERQVSKTYLALVTGSTFKNGETEFSMPLSRYIARPGLELMRAARPGDQKSQSAVTRWRVLASSGSTHLLAVEPLTGRMHQIRVHLSIEGRPILGDPYYGGAGTLKGEPVPRLMLHAARLEVPHPTAGGRIALTPASDFLAVVAAAGIRNARSGLARRIALWTGPQCSMSFS